MLGCGLSSSSINNMLSKLNRSAKPVTILFLCAGDDVVIFECRDGVWAIGLSLDLTKYDTAQTATVLEVEKEFIIYCMPAYATLINNVFDTYLKSRKFYQIGRDKITFRRIMRLSGAADTSLGNTIINLGLCIMLTNKFTIANLDDIHFRALNEMKYYGFTYTGPAPGIIEKQTFLRGTFVITDGNLVLVPTLGVILKPLFRVKDFRKFGLTYEDLAWGGACESLAASLITCYIKTYMHSMQSWPICPEIRELINKWEQVPVQIDTQIMNEIMEDRRYTIDWVESSSEINWYDLFNKRYGREAFHDLFALFSPGATYGSFVYDEDLITIMVADYGLTQTLLSV